MLEEESEPVVIDQLDIDGGNGFIIDGEQAIVVDNEDVEEEDIVINIYPNPTNNRINLNGDVIEFRLYDLSGQLINDIESSVSEDGSMYDLTNLSSDIYIAVIITEEGTRTLKVIKK